MFPKDALLSIYAHIRAHLGIRENFHGIHPSGVHTFFLKKSFCVLIDERFQRKTGSYFFSRASWLFSQIIFIFFLFIYFFQSIFLSKRFKNNLKPGHGWYPRLHFIEKGVRMKVHKTSIFGVSDKPSQSMYDNMPEAVKLLTMQ